MEYLRISRRDAISVRGAVDLPMQESKSALNSPFAFPVCCPSGSAMFACPWIFIHLSLLFKNMSVSSGTPAYPKFAIESRLHVCPGEAKSAACVPRRHPPPGVITGVAASLASALGPVVPAIARVPTSGGRLALRTVDQQHVAGHVAVDPVTRIDEHASLPHGWPGAAHAAAVADTPVDRLDRPGGVRLP